MATNGSITKKIMKAAKTQTGDALRKTVTPLLNSFPLSSHKLVYDADEGTVPPEAWAVLIAACVATDKGKLEMGNRFSASYGLPPKKEFGRYSE